MEKTTSLKQIFIFHGNDNYTSLEKLKLWLKSFQKKYPASSLIRLEADEMSATDLNKRLDEIVFSGTLFAETKLIIIKRLDLKSEIFEPKNNFFKTVPERTFLLFWFDRQLLEKELKSFSIDHELLVIEKFTIPDDPRSFEKWFSQALVKRGLPAIPLVSELASVYGRDQIKKIQGRISVPYDLGVISNNLDSLSVVNYKNKDLLNHLVSANIQPQIFDLIDNISAQKLTNSLLLIDDLLKSHDAHFIFSMILWHFRLLLKVFAAYPIYSQPALVAKRLKVSPFQVQKLWSLVQKLSPQDMEKIFSLLLSHDQKIKAGYQPDWVLESLVIQFCALRTRPKDMKL